ncbi:MAG: flagellar hook-length control protein FliK [Spirochaetales bacterium]|nr:flagellar hook-length control protein FliK [Spirochaetales bacterium]
MTNTSMAQLLFSKQDKQLADILNNNQNNKIYDNKALKNKAAKESDGNKEADRDTLTSFKKVFENEVKKRTVDKDQKNKSPTEELKKGKSIKPFYVIPKDKKGKASLLIDADKKIWEKLLKQLNEEKSKKQPSNQFALHDEIFTMVKSNKAGIQQAELLAKQLLENITTVNKKENKPVKKPKLVVVDLRAKDPVKKNVHNPKNNNSKNVLFNQKVDMKTNIKHDENGLDKEEIKLFTKNMSTDAYDAEVKTEFLNRHVPVKQPHTQFAQLQKNLNAELVKHTKLIIKDGGNGEIRLVLKPKTLGSVRVNVNIQDNNIVGKIFVDNNIVKELVQSSLNNLYNAFKEEGFNQAMINVFVGSEKNQAHPEAEEYETALHKNQANDFWNNDETVTEEIASVDSLVNIVL